MTLERDNRVGMLGKDEIW